MGSTWQRTKVQWPVIALGVGLLVLPFAWRTDCSEATPVLLVGASIVAGSLLVAFVLRMALLADRPPRSATFAAGWFGVAVAICVG